jgi:proteasome lid subunit RPN8/RPN11
VKDSGRSKYHHEGAEKTKTGIKARQFVINVDSNSFFFDFSVSLCFRGESPFMLKLASKDYEALRKHGEETYPHECCGVLLGRFDDDGSRIVTSTARCGNTRTDSPQNRYNIDPRELVRIQREGRERGEDIVGFYHSHPDHPARWSPTDFAEAHWIGCSYVITSVDKGKAAITNSFELSGSDESNKQLVDEKIEIG